VASGRVSLQSVMNIVRNIQVPLKYGEFLDHFIYCQILKRGFCTLLVVGQCVACQITVGVSAGEK
jgi:hypothetical protein